VVLARLPVHTQARKQNDLKLVWESGQSGQKRKKAKSADALSPENNCSKF